MEDVDDGLATDKLTDRASGGGRLIAVVLGIAAVMFGATAPYLSPDRFVWAWWVALALFFPVWCLVTVFGVRGREDELRDLSARTFVGKLIGAAIAAIVFGLLSLVF